jgi:hypothetical protein
VQGYFFCFEHPSDAPYAGWYEGYAAESIAEFRDYAKNELGDLDTVNRRWHTNFASWTDLVPPSRLGEFTDRYWADWLRFRADAINGFLKGLVSTARAVDPHRLIVVYGDGVREPAWFRDQGCLMANGGSHDAMQIPAYASFGLLGLPERTEDHSPGNWTAYFPTQPDASVFAMMTGGGINTHCKAYVRIRFGLEDAKDPEVSLGRYKRFMPIWTALRQTEVPPIDTRFFAADDGRLLSGRSTWGAWGSDTWGFLGAMQAHVPIAAGKADLWREARLLMLPTAAATVLDDSTMDDLAKYAEEGGTLLMWGDSGRRSIDRPDEEWVLLRRFGFTPPAGPCQEQRRVKAVPVAGDVFPATAKPFTVRDYWETAVTPETNTVATINGDAAKPLVVWRAAGKGRVLVIWGKTVLPPMVADGDANYAFLRDVARWAGARLTADSDQPLFWLNLLAGRDGKSWFGLVHMGEWQGVPSKAASGQVRWLTLPDGTYQVTELIHRRDLGRQSGEALRTTGMPVTLGPREVGIYQISSVAK